MKGRLLVILFFLGNCCLINARNLLLDDDNSNLKDFFKYRYSTYTISNLHVFSDTLYIPEGSVLRFKGGRLAGPIVFNRTLLEGDVNLKGSSIKGTIRNRVFDASWICAMDGNSDDAPIINEILNVCGHVFFPKGRYLLVSGFDPIGDWNQVTDKPYHINKTHISINKSNVSLEGEEGTEFYTSSEITTICICSKPYQIRKSIHDIRIENITFTVMNDGSSFRQWTHTINLIGVNRVLVKGCVFNDFHGDAICLNHYGDNPVTGERTRNQNVRIQNNTIIGGDTHNNRNGISVISGKNVLIKGNIIKNTSRDDMPGGIDVEPNNSAYTINKIRIEGNHLEGIEGAGGAICLIVFNGAPAHNVSIIDNSISNCKNGFYIHISTEDTTDRVVIKNNVVKCANAYCFYGNGTSNNWVVINNLFENPPRHKIPGTIYVKHLKIK